MKTRQMVTDSYSRIRHFSYRLHEEPQYLKIHQTFLSLKSFSYTVAFFLKSQGIVRTSSA